MYENTHLGIYVYIVTITEIDVESNAFDLKV